MMTRTRSIFVVLLASLLAAFVPDSAHAQKRQRDRITRDEIEGSAHKHLDAFQMIRNMRPHFLEPPKGVRSFGGSNAPFTPIALYVDGRRDSGIDALRTMDPLTIEEIRYLDPTRAENEFGPNAANGAVVVKLRKVKSQTPPDETTRRRR